MVLNREDDETARVVFEQGFDGRIERGLAGLEHGGHVWLGSVLGVCLFRIHSLGHVGTALGQSFADILERSNY